MPKLFTKIYDKILNDKKTRILFFSIITLICVAVVSIGIYIEFFYQYSESDPLMIGINNGNKKEDEENNILKNEFNSIFNNKCVGKITEIRLEKLQLDKEIIYTRYNLNNEDENYYQIDVKIPMLNINTEAAQKINEEIKKEFYDNANNIMRAMDGYTIYNVSFASYINDDIISIVVKSTLKEDGKNERLIVKTYNYNASTEKQINLDELINIKQIDKKQVQITIKKEIKKAYNKAKAIAEQYGSTYNRDLENPMYEINDGTEFFITNEGNVYIVYPYGNIEYTNEIDIIIF